MSLERFFLEQPLPESGATCSLGADEARHLAGVIRAAVGREVTLFDGRGTECRARVLEVEKRRVSLRVLEHLACDRSPRVAVELAVALPRGGAADDVLRRALEIGVQRVIPLDCERSVHRPDRKDAAKKSERFRRLAVAAMKANGVNLIPELGESKSLKDFLDAERPAQCAAFFGDTDPMAPSLLRSCASLDATTLKAVRLVIGPEGGLSPAECDALKRAGFLGMSFGPVVLRIESAVAVGVGMLAAISDDAQDRLGPNLAEPVSPSTPSAD